MWRGRSPCRCRGRLDRPSSRLDCWLRFRGHLQRRRNGALLPGPTRAIDGDPRRSTEGDQNFQGEGHYAVGLLHSRWQTEAARHRKVVEAPLLPGSRQGQQEGLDDLFLVQGVVGEAEQQDASTGPTYHAVRGQLRRPPWHPADKHQDAFPAAKQDLSPPALRASSQHSRSTIESGWCATSWPRWTTLTRPPS